jgi:AcrR family transcriptional regulator
MARRRTTSLKRETRSEHADSLLKAAYELIPTTGIAGLRTRDIAERAGVHLATFHYCFESKDALISALYDKIMDRFSEMLDNHIIKPKTMSERLQAHKNMRKYMIEEDPNMLIVCQSIVAQSWTDPKTAEYVRRNLHDLRQRIVNSITEQKVSGVIGKMAEIDPMATAAVILGITDSAFMQIGLDPEDVRLDRFEAVLDCMFSALGHDADESAEPAP